MDPFGLVDCEAAVAAERKRKEMEELAIDARKRQDWDALYDAEERIKKFLREYDEAMDQAGNDSRSPKPPEPKVEEPAPDPNSESTPPIDPGKLPNLIFEPEG